MTARNAPAIFSTRIANVQPSDYSSGLAKNKRTTKFSRVAGSVSNYAYQTNIYTQKVWPFYSKNERDIFQRIVLQSEFVKAAPPPLKGKDATSSLDDVEILNGHI